jgi:Tol biopolymer transport system component
VVSLKTIARFCSMLLLLALILTPAGSVRATPGNTTRVSVASDGTQANDRSVDPSISADGRYVAFAVKSQQPGERRYEWRTRHLRSRPADWPDHPRLGRFRRSASKEWYHLRLIDRRPSLPTGAMWRLHSYATNLVSGDTNQSLRTSSSTTGRLARPPASLSLPTGRKRTAYSAVPSISADGRYVAFAFVCSQPGERGYEATWDVFVHDRQTGADHPCLCGSGRTTSQRQFVWLLPSLQMGAMWRLSRMPPTW